MGNHGNCIPYTGTKMASRPQHGNYFTPHALGRGIHASSSRAARQSSERFSGRHAVPVSMAKRKLRCLKPLPTFMVKAYLFSALGCAKYDATRLLPMSSSSAPATEEGLSLAVPAVLVVAVGHPPLEARTNSLSAVQIAGHHK